LSYSRFREIGPGSEPGTGSEPGHVPAGLGDDDLRGALPYARDGDQPGDQGGERRGRLGDQPVQLGELGAQVIVGGDRRKQVHGWTTDRYRTP
jgi:hypothetical protein